MPGKLIAVAYALRVHIETSSLYAKFVNKNRCIQEIYRPGTTISYASNLCTALEGDQNKEFRGNASFLSEKGARGGIEIYCY